MYLKINELYEKYNIEIRHDTFTWQQNSDTIIMEQIKCLILNLVKSDTILISTNKIILEFPHIKWLLNIKIKCKTCEKLHYEGNYVSFDSEKKK